ncbi:MAG: TRAP transporter large permease subunit, partial [Planctomycetota bacterium]
AYFAGAVEACASAGGTMMPPIMGATAFVMAEMLQVDYRDITRGFRPDLGYIPRRDIRGPGSHMRYREYYDQGIFKSFSLFSEAQIYENNDHDTTLRDFLEGAVLGFRNEIELWYIRSDSFHAPYQNWYDQIRVEYNEEVDVWDSISVSFAKGVYEEEPYKEYSLEKPMKITERLVTTFEGNYRLKHPEAGGDEEIWLWRSVTQYTFPWNGRIKFTAEQTSEDRHNLTMLFSWPMKDNTDLYFLLNDYEVDGEKVRAAFFKIVYRF